MKGVDLESNIAKPYLLQIYPWVGGEGGLIWNLLEGANYEFLLPKLWKNICKKNFYTKKLHFCHFWKYLIFPKKFF